MLDELMNPELGLFFSFLKRAQAFGVDVFVGGGEKAQIKFWGVFFVHDAGDFEFEIFEEAEEGVEIADGGGLGISFGLPGERGGGQNRVERRHKFVSLLTNRVLEAQNCRGGQICFSRYPRVQVGV